jgi:hypothetical protein
MDMMNPAGCPGGYIPNICPKSHPTGTGDTEQDSDDASARVPSGHEQLGDYADNQAEDDPAENSEQNLPPVW